MPDVNGAITPADVEHAHREGTIAALIGIEGGHAIEDNLRPMAITLYVGCPMR